MARFALLGPVEAITSEGAVDTGPRKQRALLARLLVDAGRVVSIDALADAVWETPPPSVQASLQVFVSHLRKALRDPTTATSPIVRRGAGYVLQVARDDIDLGEFATGCGAVQAAVDARRWSDAVGAADATLALWRGPLAEEFADQEWVRVASGPLEELRSTLQANRVRALLGADQVDLAVAGAHSLAAQQPLNETAVWLQAVALHRAGRSPEALETLRAYAELLDEELALETGPAVRDLQAGILRQEPELRTWPNDETPAPHQDRDARPAVPAVLQPEVDQMSDSWSTAATDGVDDFVGRRRELAAAAGVISGGLPGTGARWLVLEGEAGIGKSRLAERVAASWTGRIVRASCPEDDGVPLWWPVRRLLEGVGVDPDSVLVTPVDADADAARFTVYDSVRRTLATALDAGPLLLVVEDVHWADFATLRLLAHLAGTAADQLSGLAVTVTSRPFEGSPAGTMLMSTIARRAGSRVLRLPPLSSGEVADLAMNVSGSRLDAQEAAQLTMRTGGNPFFVCEYARLSSEDRADAGVPVAVSTVLDRRLATLDVATLQLLRIAAVIGDTLDIELLGRVSRIERDALADLLDEAADERIIVAATTDGDGPGGTYSFGHALLRAKLLADLPDLRRQRLHLRVAEAVPGNDIKALSRRAAHLVAAETFADAHDTFVACRDAAQAYEERLEPELAATWWAHAIAAFDRLGETEADGSDRDDLVVAQVISLARSGRGQTVLDVIDAALLDTIRRARYDSVARLAATLLRTSGSWPWAVYGTDPGPLLARLTDLESLVRDHPAAHVRVLAALAVGSCYSPDADVPDRLSRQAVTIAEEIDDPAALVDALLGRALAFSGVAIRAEESLELLERLGGLRDKAGSASTERNHDDVIAHGLAYLATVSLGRLEDAAEHVRAGVARSDLLRLSTSRVQFRWAEASLMLARGEDTARVESLVHRANELHRQTELYQSGTYDIAMFTLRWQQERLTEGDLADADPRNLPWAAAVAAAAARRSDAAGLIAADLARLRLEPPLWTTHARLTLLGHATADVAARDLAPELLRLLGPFAERVANIGQVSLVGPVSLAVARLHALLGETDAAAQALSVARSLATQAKAAGWHSQCTKVAAELELCSPAAT